MLEMINYKGSKNISIKMLKDVGMTVPKSRETYYIKCKKHFTKNVKGCRDGSAKN